MISPRDAFGTKGFEGATNRGLVVCLRALAVVLGVGAAAVSTPAIAAADTNGSSSSSGSISPSSSNSKAIKRGGPRVSIRSTIRTIREATGGKSGLLGGIWGTRGSGGADGSSPRVVWTIVEREPDTALPGDGGGVTNTPNGLNSHPVNIVDPISAPAFDPYIGWTKPGNLVIPATGGPPVVAASFAPPGAPFVAANGQLVIPGAPAIG